MDHIDGSCCGYGAVRLLGEGRTNRETKWTRNLLTYDWATAAAALFAGTPGNYHVGGMFLEYENVENPGDEVTPPTLDRTRNIDYYVSLGSSPSRDFLRVGLAGKAVSTTDDLNYKGNSITYLGRSSGVRGVHGKDFSDTANSRVFGVSLVAFVDPGDFTKDIVLASAYLSGSSQMEKTPGGQIIAEYRQWYT